LVRQAGSPSARDVAAAAFAAAARMHATFWGQERLLSLKYLRGVGWAQGRDEALWQQAQETAVKGWESAKQDMTSGSPRIQWNEAVVAAIDASLSKISWVDFQKEFQSRPWTLVHGDFHPANMLWLPSAGPGEAPLRVVDWEMVGLGSGPQDLGQYVISHMDPALRRQEERGLIEGYHKALTAQGVSISLEQCWDEYVKGGAGRWLWFIPVLLQMVPPKMVQFLHNQLAEFLKDHGIDATNAPMPRV